MSTSSRPSPASVHALNSTAPTRAAQAVMEAGGCRTEILDDADAIGLWEGKAIALVRAAPSPRVLCYDA